MLVFTFAVTLLLSQSATKSCKSFSTCLTLVLWRPIWRLWLTWTCQKEGERKQTRRRKSEKVLPMPPKKPVLETYVSSTDGSHYCQPIDTFAGSPAATQQLLCPVTPLLPPITAHQSHNLVATNVSCRNSTVGSNTPSQQTQLHHFQSTQTIAGSREATQQHVLRNSTCATPSLHHITTQLQSNNPAATAASTMTTTMIPRQQYPVFSAIESIPKPSPPPGIFVLYLFSIELLRLKSFQMLWLWAPNQSRWSD